MSFEILEAVRRSIVKNIDDVLSDIGSTIELGDKVRPEDTKGQQKFENNQLPLITFACLTDAEELATGIWTARIRLSVFYRGDAKDKNLWDLHTALKASCTVPLVNASILAQIASPPNPAYAALPIYVHRLKQDGESDDSFNEKADAYQIRTVWECKYVRI